MSVEQSMEWELTRKTKVLGENLPRATLSTTNPTWPDLWSNPGRRGGTPATNRPATNPYMQLEYLVSWGRALPLAAANRTLGRVKPTVRTRGPCLKLARTVDRQHCFGPSPGFLGYSVLVGSHQRADKKTFPNIREFITFMELLRNCFAFPCDIISFFMDSQELIVPFIF
jgi:hypothetical protein